MLQKLVEAKVPITGGELAQWLKVSRQVIVQDIALLRAKGNNILATPQGYILADKIAGSYRATIACQHDHEGMRRELEIIVRQGARVIDVTVEHPVYGEIQGLLMVKSLEDVEQFIAKINETEAKPLSILTDGIHLHTIEADSESLLTTVKELLEKEGLIVK